MVVLSCPGCAQDIPCEELSAFVRYYDGDEGGETCPHCEMPLIWKMSISEDISRLGYKELLLRQGKIEADFAQYWADLMEPPS